MPVLFDPERQLRFPLGEGVTTIGRDPACSVHLSDPMVAPRHAEVRRGADARYRVIDLGSRRGTFHGDRRVSEALLADGDELLLGGVRLRFEDAAPAEQAQPLLYPPAAEVQDLARLRRDYDKLRAAFELSQGLAAARSLDALLPAVLHTAFRVLKADRGLIVLLDPLTLQPTLQISSQRDGKPGDITISTHLLSEVIRQREGVITADTGQDARFNRAESLFAQSVRSAMCVPMLHQGQLVGAIQLDSQLETGRFDQGDLELFAVMASQAASAIHGALLTAQVHSVVSDERARLGRLISDLPDGVLLLDGRRRVLLQNQRAEELLAPLGGVAAGEPIEEIGPLSIAALLESRTSVDLAVSDKPRRTLSLQATESPSPLGLEVVVLIRDVTSERERDDRVVQEGRLALLGQLAGGVAHDFNNILAVISNVASFLYDAASDETMRSDIEQIQLAASRAAELTKRLLAFGRREHVRPRVITVEAVLAGMEAMLRRLLGVGVRLEVRCAPAPWRVKADPSQLEQVVLNLAVNSRDAMPGGGDLLLETTQVDLDEDGAREAGLLPGRYVSLLARDTGAGMTPEVLARAFEPFFTTKERGKGTGLGLATVYGIVTQAGGSARIESEPGKGTSFRVLLPATTEEPKLEDLRRERIPAAGNSSVLVAEDDPSVREITRRILESAGYRVKTAPDAEAALRLATEDGARIDLLLTDLVMPGLGGKQLARVLRQRQPDLPVLYMSAYFEDAVAANAEGIELLGKPFSRGDLLEHVRRLLVPLPRPGT